MKLTLALAASLATSTLATPLLSWKAWGKGQDSKHPWSSNNNNKWGNKDKSCKEDFSPFTFTSTYSIHATPDQVVNGTTPTGGLEGASGLYLFGLNSAENTICYNITLTNFRGEYQSAAATATHIHEAVRGASGPPRVAFPNPVPVAGQENARRSIGCLTGPFVTGTKVAGVDNGANFQVKQIEDNPAAFFADVHSSLAVPGAVRGQIA